MLESGNEVILVNWLHEKHTECNKNNDIPDQTPNALFNRSVLSNCEMKIQQHVLNHLLN